MHSLAHPPHHAIIGLMKRIYTAANLPDAHLVRDLLQQAGIPAHIFNAHAMGALGDLPMGSAHPQVWITQLHQETQARAVIAKYSDRATVSVAHLCAACQESNPGEFELCWNCGAELA
jgi:hypothetical protein